MSFTKEFFKACVEAGVTDLVLFGEPAHARLLDTGEKGLIVKTVSGRQEVIELVKFEDVQEVNVRV